MSKQPDEKPEVLSITDVPESHTDEMHRRMVQYTLAMAIRLACLLLFFFIDSWVRWFFVGGAVFLPWIAVIIANGGSDKSNLQHSTALLDQAPQPELEAPSARTKDAAADTDEVLTGELIDDAAPGPEGSPGPSSPPAHPASNGSGPEPRPAPAAPDGPAAADAAAQEDPQADDRPAEFTGNLSPVTKRRWRKAAA
jgi:hypothetical protein